MADFLIGIFIAAAREAATWPKPHRFEARAALLSLNEEFFEGGFPRIRSWGGCHA